MYDEMCFERGIPTLDEILKGLNQTSLFVLFISDKSLDSDWVKREVAEAENRIWDTDSRLVQVFPIIIDSSITHKDDRIPAFLKDKFGSYNIQHFQNPKIAYRKILSQYKRLLMNKGRSIEMGYSHKVFYGRHRETFEFQDHFENGRQVQCLIVSGILGIGKQSFIVHALRETGIIEKYYEPPVVSMKKDDGIIDLIMRLIEIGFGNLTFDDISKLTRVDDQIQILSSLLSEIQECNEHVIVYDDAALVSYQGEVKYWLCKALNSIRWEMTISIASSVAVNFSFLTKNRNFIGIDLTTLGGSEWKGLLREYGKTINVDLNKEEIEYFSDIITGYPPQVIFCADIIKQEGIEYVKKNGHEVVAAVSDNIARVVALGLDIPKYDKKLGQGFLLFLSNYGIMPTSILEDVIDLNEAYRNYYNRFKSLTIIRLLGATKEYVEVNPAVADFIQRNVSDSNDDIDNFLERKYNEFLNKLENGDVSDEDFESLRLFLKKTVKDKRNNSSLLYSTIYLSAVRELYDEYIREVPSTGLKNRATSHS